MTYAEYDEARADYNEVSTTLLSEFWEAFCAGSIQPQLQGDITTHLANPPEAPDDC